MDPSTGYPWPVCHLSPRRTQTTTTESISRALGIKSEVVWMVEQWVLRIFGSSRWELSNSSSAETSASSEVCSVYVRTIWQMPDWTVTNFNFVLCRITKQICIHAADTHFLLLHLISNSSSFQSAQASSPQVRSKYSPFYKRLPRGHCFASTYF